MIFDNNEDLYENNGLMGFKRILIPSYILAVIKKFNDSFPAKRNDSSKVWALLGREKTNFMIAIRLSGINALTFQNQSNRQR